MTSVLSPARTTPHCLRVSSSMQSSNETNSSRRRILPVDHTFPSVPSTSSSRPNKSSTIPQASKISRISSPGGSVPSLARQLKKLRNSSNSQEARTAILALLPIVHKWIQIDVKRKAQASNTAQSNQDPNGAFPNELENSNQSKNGARRVSTTNALRLGGNSTTDAANATVLFQQLHGVSILVLSLKEWEQCPVVVANALRILALLVSSESSIGHALVEMGGVRVIVRAISKHHSKNEEPMTACVALLSELALHMPSTVGSDACLAMVVHSLWRFPQQGFLQLFGFLFFERVLLPVLFLWGVSSSEEDSAKKGDDEDAWNVTTIHQTKTLKKVVVPLLIHMKQNHHSSNPTLCQSAENLCQSIYQRLYISSLDGPKKTAAVNNNNI